jgi:hypothetical protein
MAAAMGIELLTEEQYRDLQKLGNFDTKTSSWMKTPSDIRKLGGSAISRRAAVNGIPNMVEDSWRSTRRIAF